MDVLGDTELCATPKYLWMAPLVRSVSATALAPPQHLKLFLRKCKAQTLQGFTAECGISTDFGYEGRAAQDHQITPVELSLCCYNREQFLPFPLQRCLASAKQMPS